MEKIIPFLYFDGNAEQAVKFYLSIFKNSRIVDVSRWGDTGPGPKGSVMTITFQLEGQDFMALNGGPEFKFSPAISFMVHCRDQKEIDRLWARLSKGGEKWVCGWLKDKFGISWQIVPAEFRGMITDPDPEKVERFMQAMVKMKKFNIQKLRQAYRGGK